MDGCGVFCCVSERTDLREASNGTAHRLVGHSNEAIGHFIGRHVSLRRSVIRQVGTAIRVDF